MFGLRGGIVVDRNAHAGMAMRGTISTKASSAQNVISSGVYRRLEREDDMFDRDKWWSAIIIVLKDWRDRKMSGGRARGENTFACTPFRTDPQDLSGRAQIPPRFPPLFFVFWISAHATTDGPPRSLLQSSSLWERENPNKFPPVFWFFSFQPILRRIPQGWLPGHLGTPLPIPSFGLCTTVRRLEK